MIIGAGLSRIKLPQGFLAGGVNCGIRRYRPDLGMIVLEKPGVAAGVFTQNTCKAAPVQYCEQLLPANNIRALITNSGQANAATGVQGVKDNATMASWVAQHLQCDQMQVLTASTGVIGECLMMDKIKKGIPTLLTSSMTYTAERFALAILTTDLVPKTVMREVDLSTGKIMVTGICKGSGMIHPNMATMLGYILTDAKLTMMQTDMLLKRATKKSFNMISVDGETSTNDSVFMLASGASNVLVTSSEDFKKVEQAIEEIAILLAKSIARDGEGASKLLEIEVKGLQDIEKARQIARSLTVSPLIKTAVHGESPNWGRIIARIGAEKVPLDVMNSCCIYIEGCQVFPLHEQNKEDEDIGRLMKADEIRITVDFASGDRSATAWGCDLTEEYVKINAEYLT